MVTDAKAHAAEDKKKREAIDVRNQADQMVYQTEKNISELGDKLDTESKNKLEAATSRVKEAIKTDNVDEIKSSLQDLEKLWNELSGKIYQQATAEGAGGPQAGGAAQAEGDGEGAEDKDVEEADFEVVDDDKKE